MEAKSFSEMLRAWGAFVFGAAAFLVSLLTAYVTTFRVVDELRVVVTAEPRLDLGDDNVHIRVQGPLKLLFINSGTRPISILEVSLVLGEVENEGCRSERPSERSSESSTELKGKIDGIVIEEKKIVSSTVILEAPAGPPSELASVRADTISLNWDQKQHEIASYLVVRLATISDSRLRCSEKLSSTWISLESEAKVVPRSAPIILHSQSRLVFGTE